MGLRVDALSFAYDDRTVLHDVSFHLERGRFGVVLGRNGSGKSTLLRVIAGLLAGSGGRVFFGETDAATLSARARAQRVGYLGQFHTPMFSFTAIEVVLTGRAAHAAFQPRETDLAAAHDALALLGIDALAARPYDTLSGGERQLVLLARVLAQQPTVLLLDEPVSHLDLANQMHLLHALRTLTAEGVTVLAVLHDPNHALLFADTVICLAHGRLRTPPGDDPRDAAFLSELYGLPVHLGQIGGQTLLVPALHGKPSV